MTEQATGSSAIRVEKQEAMREQQNAAVRLTLLAAEAMTYGHFSVAKRRLEHAITALDVLPDLFQQPGQDPWEPPDHVCQHGMAEWLCASPGGGPTDPHYPVHL